MQEMDNAAPPPLVVLALSNSFFLAYKVDVYAAEPFSRKFIYINANTGEILKEINRIHETDVIGTAHTRYSGERSIHTDSLASTFRLHDNTRGGGIITRDMNSEYDYWYATDITDSDNIWEVANHNDDAALDAHWGTAMTYDYYLEIHGRNSFDNDGAPLLSYVDFDYNYSNAFWDGERMTYGAGGGIDNPFTPLDVVGHEITHGVTEHTAGLIYEYQSGALNESFSDIFGVTIDFYARGDDANYIMGEDIRNPPIRSMENPNLRNNPDTYEGDFWEFGSYDYGGVHINSGVQNYWFYLLVEGGVGVNDNGDEYAVSAIGMDAAAAIAYRNLSIYLTPYSDYADARTFSIQSAIDLYGTCSDEVIAVTNAWYAVGVGEFFDDAVLANFNSGANYACQVPANIQFNNLSFNGTSWLWAFGDGNTSSEENPLHTYDEAGTYTITLIVDGSEACGNSDTLSIVNYITVTNEGGPISATCQPATVNPASNQGISYVEIGSIANNSGPSTNGYEDFTCTSFTNLTEGSLYPISIQAYSNEYVTVWLDLNNNGIFAADEGIYSSQDAAINHTANIIIPQGLVYSQPLLMRVQSSQTLLSSACAQPVNGQVEDYQFVMLENNDQPIALFEASAELIQVNQSVSFTDLSLNLPDSWEWIFEGGTPENSNLQHPSVQYTETGDFDVSLIVSNEFGADTLTLLNYISVVNSINMCEESNSTAINGQLYDSGGPGGNYSDYENCSLLISPGCAQSITLTFDYFALEGCCDYFRVYDGPDASSPLLLSANGTSLPSPVTGESGELYITFSSDYSVTYGGWSATWTSETPTEDPVAGFTTSNSNIPLNTSISFTDNTTEFPNVWLWNFGDGNTSSEQNPEHVYSGSGDFEVTLIAYNCYNSDTTSQTITVQEPPVFNILPADTLHATVACGSTTEGSFTIYNYGAGDLVVNLTGDQTGSSAISVLSLITYADMDEEYSNTLSAINTHFSDFELFESTAINSAQLEQDLENIDVLLIPEQEFAWSFFPSLSTAITDFAENGGKILICGNEYLFSTGLFIAGNSWTDSNELLANLQPTHPIVSGINDSFFGTDATYFYSWDSDVDIIPLLVNDNNPDLFAVAVKTFGEGTVVYVGFDFYEVNDNNSLVIANALEYLAENVQTNWIESISMDSPSVILPGDSLVVSVLFDAEDLLGGDYYYNGLFTSNDPDNLSSPYIFHLEVTGEALLSLSEDNLEFDPLMAGLNVTDTIIVYNNGCESLSVSTELPAGAFDIIPAELNIAGYSQDTLFITFQPTAAGSFSEIIEVVSNGGDTLITLSAEALAAPDIVVDPEELSIDVTACADSVLVSFNIFNEGQGILDYSLINSNGNMPIDEVLMEINEHYSEITELIPSIHNFSEGESGNYISDGGGDMYDGGNFLNTNLQTNITYTSSNILTNNSFGPQSSYFTSKYPGLFLLTADLNAILSFSVTGDLGADGSGSKNSTVLTYTHPSGISYKAFISRVYGSGDPTINHLIITENSEDISHSTTSGTYDENHVISGLNNSERLYYLLFSTNSSNEFISDSQMQEIFEVFADLITAPINVATNQSGEVNPSESQPISLYLYTSEYPEGIHEVPIVITSNDPDQPLTTVYVNLNMPGNACADFEFDNLGDCNGFVHFTDESLNNPTSWAWDFGDGNTSNEQNPIHNYEETGNYQVSLEVCNGVDCNEISNTISIENVNGPISPVCTPSTGGDYNEYHITQVSFNSVVNQSTGSAEGYQDFSCLPPIQAITSNIYALNVSVSPNDYYDIRVWIDYNNNGQFNSDELVLNNTSVFGNTTAMVTIPQNAEINIPLRMRVLADPYYAIEPCANLVVGEGEDYSIFISPVNSPPTTNFSWEVIDDCQGVYQFNDLSGNLPNAWMWNFGDGTSSALQNPFHIFENGGEYNVQLTASNNFGSDDYVSIVNLPFQGFENIVILNTPVLNEAVNFEAPGDGVVSRTWDFGDGSSEVTSTPNVSHTYTQTGNYEVIVTTQDDVCQNTMSTIVNVTLTGINENLAQKLEYLVYPNPSKGNINISYRKDLDISELRIYDAVGRVIPFVQKNKESGRIEINLSNSIAGVYILMVRMNTDDVFHSRIVVE